MFDFLMMSELSSLSVFFAAIGESAFIRLCFCVCNIMLLQILGKSEPFLAEEAGVWLESLMELFVAVQAIL